MLLALVVAVVCGILAVFFASDNQVGVQVRMLGLQLEGRLGIVIVLAFGLGALVGILMLLPAYLAQGWALIRCRRKVEDLGGLVDPREPDGAKLV